MNASSQRLLFKCFAASAVALVLTACGNNASTTTTTGNTSTLAASDFAGPFVFSMSGTDPNDGDYSIAGTFTADGKGNITGGIADFNLGSGVDPNVPFTGTYTAANGIATISITDGGSVQESYFVPIVKSGTATITRYDGTGNGTLYAAATPTTATAGTYAVNISGEGDGSVSATAKFTTVAAGTFTGGTYSYTDGANLLSYPAATGFLSPVSANGRGQAYIVGNNFSYYMASAATRLDRS